jgi:hypothetical protein
LQFGAVKHTSFSREFDISRVSDMEECYRFHFSRQTSS